MTASHIAAWFLLNLLPFSFFGWALMWAGLHYDRCRSRRSRLVLGMLVAALFAVTGCTTARSFAVVYDYCGDPNTPGWLWWLTCALK
jgi:hypothetical protein